MLGRLTLHKYARYVKIFVKPFNQETCRSDESIRRFISENTEIVGQHSLTPEVKLRLLTPNCRFWRERPELWPLDDPYWAIYWPGGQALSRRDDQLLINNWLLLSVWVTAATYHLVPSVCRYLLDNPGVCRNKTVLDLGCGCGASAIAAKLCGAAHVVANDIDTGIRLWFLLFLFYQLCFCFFSCNILHLMARL